MPPRPSYSAHLHELGDTLDHEADKARLRGVYGLEDVLREASQTVYTWSEALSAEPAR